MGLRLKTRRISVVVVMILGVITWLLVNPSSYEEIFTPVENTGAEASLDAEASEDYEAEAVSAEDDTAKLATEVLDKLEVKGRASKSGYAREEFYAGWPIIDGCSLRQKIIKREFGDTAVLDGCNVVAGEFDEPYTGEHMKFTEREQISRGIQIDHVVALSDAWQKGAQYMDRGKRYEIATDPLNLLAVDAKANQGKSDGDAATWLPPNKKFRCQYVARQVSVKYKHSLWVTETEKNAIVRILEKCPKEPAIGV